ncbi:MAG: hypothetical protein ACI9OJ_003743, partial [Myxococcota bacterium]
RAFERAPNGTLRLSFLGCKFKVGGDTVRAA